jgi:vitamin B12/bleomycin/antimicrobial peptide transport system ATP-binding/permease protein
VAAVAAMCGRLAADFWRGPNWRKAWLITAGAIGFELTNIAFQVAINRWNRSFFDALEQRSPDGLTGAAIAFIPLAIAAIAAVAAAILCKVMLQIYWRQSVTETLTKQWLSDRAFYRMNVLHGANIAPEHRLTEDARMTVAPVVDLTIGFLSAVLTFTIFVGVLWTVGGSMTMGGIAVPGFMVLAAILYAITIWSMMALIGAPYTQRVRDRSEAEARFRFELTRVRENAESIALISGEDGERRRLAGHYSSVITAWTRVAWRWSQMSLISHGNSVVGPIIPMLLMAPKYLSGEVSLGVVMQAAAAFGSVQASVGWFTTNYAGLSEWYASASRVCEIDLMMREAAAVRSGRTIEMAASTDGKLHLVNVSVELHDGKALVTDAQFVIAPGEMVIVAGEAGTGKSSLIRAIAGLWPWGSGQILLPANSKIAFLPQRPYIPIGSLAAAIAYPLSRDESTPAAFAEALESCGLSYLTSRLDEVQSWDKVLSGGEQQRLAFARLLISPPTLAILDEATSALDEESQSRLMELFRFRLAATTVISVSHRPSLARFHNRQIHLRREIEGTRVSVGASQETQLDQMRRALSALKTGST